MTDTEIAMGAAGTDTALETADIALMGDDVRETPNATGEHCFQASLTNRLSREK